MEDAEMHAVMDQCADVRRDVAAGLALSRDNTTLERGGRALALCGDGAEALSLSSEVGKRFPEATLTTRVSVPVIAAALAIRQRQPERAIAALEPVRRYEKSPPAEFWPSYLRGEAYLQLKNGAMAAAEFDSIVAHRGAVPGAVVYPLAWLGRARAAVLAGQADEARTAYERFFALWTSADQDLAPLAAARGEYARLLRSSSRD
jgi:hypothetical protein